MMKQKKTFQKKPRKKRKHQKNTSDFYRTGYHKSEGNIENENEPISTEDIITGYKYSESRRFATLKDMYKNIDAARTALAFPNLIPSTK